MSVSSLSVKIYRKCTEIKIEERSDGVNIIYRSSEMSVSSPSVKIYRKRTKIKIEERSDGVNVIEAFF